MDESKHEIKETAIESNQSASGVSSSGVDVNARASDIVSTQSLGWSTESPETSSRNQKNYSVFSVDRAKVEAEVERELVDSQCMGQLRNYLHRARHLYEIEGGGKTMLRLHFLTNTFYLQPSVEKNYQIWCVDTQLRSNRVLLTVIAGGFFLYQVFSALKRKHESLYMAFVVRMVASIIFALIVFALFMFRKFARYWKFFLSLGIALVLCVEVVYRAEKIYIEGELITSDVDSLLKNMTAISHDKEWGDLGSDLFKRVHELDSLSTNAIAFTTGLTLLEDELLINANRYWPMWSVIISVILHVDVIFIVPTMLTVSSCYVVVTFLYLRNDFDNGMFGDTQTMVLLVSMLFLLIWLGHYNDRFLRQTFVQIKDSGAENEKLRKKLKQLGESQKGNQHLGTNITTPMENVLLELNMIKGAVRKSGKSSHIGPALERIIDTLSKPESIQGSRLQDKLREQTEDADVTSWLIEHAGLGGGSYRGSDTQGKSRSVTSERSFARSSSTRSIGSPENLNVLMTQSAKTLLGDLDDCWDLDVLKLSEVTAGRPLFAVSWTIMQKHGLLTPMNCEASTFSNFITKIEDGYKDNPYHNSAHAADVVNGCHHFVETLGFKNTITTWETYSLLISAAIHDFEHPGVSNAFLISTKNDLAVQYNDTAVCESMHVARGFEIMQNPSGQNNILSGISEEDYWKVRRCIIDTVMATDLSKHLDFTARLRTLAANRKSEETFRDNNLLLQIAIKSSDLGHCSKKLSLHLRWTELIVEEMFQQGDKERELGKTISSFCDRTSADTPKNQIGFFEFVILPWWRALWQLDGRFGSLTHATEGNHLYWVELRNTEPHLRESHSWSFKTRSKSVTSLTFSGPTNDAKKDHRPLRSVGGTGGEPKPTKKLRRASDSFTLQQDESKSPGIHKINSWHRKTKSETS